MKAYKVEVWDRCDLWAALPIETRYFQELEKAVQYLEANNDKELVAYLDDITIE